MIVCFKGSLGLDVSFLSLWKTFIKTCCSFRSSVLLWQARHRQGQASLIRGQSSLNLPVKPLLSAHLSQTPPKKRGVCAQLKQQPEDWIAQRTLVILVSSALRVMESTEEEGRLKMGTWGARSDWTHLPVSLFLFFLLSFNQIWACLRPMFLLLCLNL